MGVSSATVVSESSKCTKKGHSSAGPRLKREDYCLPNALDNFFSPWKVLVGPNDWKNHSSGVEGVERYKLHNLPSSYFGPGVYELALHLDKCNHGKDTKKDASRFPKKDTIVVVYVGQAENVRTRLQHYGRCGSHLEGGIELLKSVKSQNCETTLSKDLQVVTGDLDGIGDSLSTLEGSCYCPQLFTMAFCQGYSIAFRWAATGSKGDAVAIETGLLKFFDYAWNRGCNGKRRPCDAFRKLQQQLKSSSDSTKARSRYRLLKWTITLPKIGASNVRNLGEKKTIFTVFNKRFWKPNDFFKRLSVSDGKNDLYLDLHSLPWKLQVNEDKCLSSCSQACLTKYAPHASVMQPSNIHICGVLDVNGIACMVMPVRGRKRCEAHKGMRLLLTSSTVEATRAKKYLLSVHAANNVGTKNAPPKSSQLLTCGYLLKDGSKCMVLPEKGRKRCLSHKGRRIKTH